MNESEEAELNCDRQRGGKEKCFKSPCTHAMHNKSKLCRQPVAQFFDPLENMRRYACYQEQQQQQQQRLLEQQQFLQQQPQMQCYQGGAGIAGIQGQNFRLSGCYDLDTYKNLTKSNVNNDGFSEVLGHKNDSRFMHNERSLNENQFLPKGKFKCIQIINHKKDFINYIVADYEVPRNQMDFPYDSKLADELTNIKPDFSNLTRDIYAHSNKAQSPLIQLVPCIADEKPLQKIYASDRRSCKSCGSFLQNTPLEQDFLCCNCVAKSPNKKDSKYCFCQSQDTQKPMEKKMTRDQTVITSLPQIPQKKERGTQWDRSSKSVGQQSEPNNNTAGKLTLTMSTAMDPLYFANVGTMSPDRQLPLTTYLTNKTSNTSVQSKQKPKSVKSTLSQTLGPSTMNAQVSTSRLNITPSRMSTLTQTAPLSSNIGTSPMPAKHIVSKTGTRTNTPLALGINRSGRFPVNNDIQPQTSAIYNFGIPSQSKVSFGASGPEANQIPWKVEDSSNKQGSCGQKHDQTSNTTIQQKTSSQASNIIMKGISQLLGVGNQPTESAPRLEGGIEPSADDFYGYQYEFIPNEIMTQEDKINQNEYFPNQINPEGPIKYTTRRPYSQHLNYEQWQIPLNDPTNINGFSNSLANGTQHIAPERNIDFNNMPDSDMRFSGHQLPLNYNQRIHNLASKRSSFNQVPKVIRRIPQAIIIDDSISSREFVRKPRQYSYAPNKYYDQYDINELQR